MGNNKQQLIDILECPDCGNTINQHLQCKGCNRQFIYCDGIYKFLPLKQLSLPPIYNDPDYMTLNNFMAEAQDYFYKNKNFLINWVQTAGHKDVMKFSLKRSTLTLDCGCGTGAHLWFNNNVKLENYIMLDIDYCSLKLINSKDLLRGVIQASTYKLPFRCGIFDRVISVAQLEHLCYLDWSLSEIKRVLKPKGEFIVSVPTEGGFLWTLGRLITSARHFSKKLCIDYIKANRIEHFNTVYQIERAIQRYFKINKRSLFPLKIPSFHMNLVSTYLLTPLT